MDSCAQKGTPFKWVASVNTSGNSWTTNDTCFTYVSFRGNTILVIHYFMFMVV